MITPHDPDLVKKMVGIYAIWHKESGKVYIGQAAVSFERRWRVHKSELASSIRSHHSNYLQHSWDKYGEAAFEFDALEIVHRGEDFKARITEREQWWIDCLGSANPEYGYNLCPAAGSAIGYKHTDESRANMAASRVGRLVSEETRAKISAANTGKLRSEEAITKNRLAQSGRSPTAETREKMSDARRGKRLSPEHCEKLRVANTGKSHSEETREKLRIINTGRVMQAETKIKISAALKGIIRSKETKAKMSAAKKYRCDPSII
jgi:group I intron endonuclease